MRTPGFPRALLVVGGVALAILAGIGTAGSFAGGGSLWGDRYASGTPSDDGDRRPTVLRAPAIRAAVDSVVTAYGQALSRGDLDRAASSYASDALSSWPGGRPAEGRPSIRNSLERTLTGGVGLEISSVEIQVISPEWASVYGCGGLAGPASSRPGEREVGTAGDTSARNHPMTFFALLRKTGDGWKVVREAVSADR